MDFISLAHAAENGLVSCGGLDCGVCEILKTVSQIFNWLLSISAAVAILLLVIGGFIYIGAKGDQNKLASAKNILFKTIVGFAIALLAWLIIHSLFKVMGAKGNWWNIECQTEASVSANLPTKRPAELLKSVSKGGDLSIVLPADTTKEELLDTINNLPEGATLVIKSDQGKKALTIATLKKVNGKIKIVGQKNESGSLIFPLVNSAKATTYASPKSMCETSGGTWKFLDEATYGTTDWAPGSCECPASNPKESDSNEYCGHPYPQPPIVGDNINDNVNITSFQDVTDIINYILSLLKQFRLFAILHPGPYQPRHDDSCLGSGGSWHHFLNNCEYVGQQCGRPACGVDQSAATIDACKCPVGTCLQGAECVPPTNPPLPPPAPCADGNFQLVGDTVSCLPASIEQNCASSGGSFQKFSGSIDNTTAYGSQSCQGNTNVFYQKLPFSTTANPDKYYCSCPSDKCLDQFSGTCTASVGPSIPDDSTTANGKSSCESSGGSWVYGCNCPAGADCQCVSNSAWCKCPGNKPLVGFTCEGPIDIPEVSAPEIGSTTDVTSAPTGDKAGCIASGGTWTDEFPGCNCSPSQGLVPDANYGYCINIKKLCTDSGGQWNVIGDELLCQCPTGSSLDTSSYKCVPGPVSTEPPCSVGQLTANNSTWCFDKNTLSQTCTKSGGQWKSFSGPSAIPENELKFAKTCDKSIPDEIGQSYQEVMGPLNCPAGAECMPALPGYYCKCKETQCQNVGGGCQ